MHLATISADDTEQPAVVDLNRGVTAIANLLPNPPADLMSVIGDDSYDSLEELTHAAPSSVFQPPHTARFTAPYRRPRKIWGIGLNYADHATDLAETVPEEPASFIKGDHTIIGPGDSIALPHQSRRTTTEGELGLVIGRYCRNVPEETALDYVFGVTTVLDQTAEDILERNPRFLTRSKNFPGFFSFGPHIVPLAQLRKSRTRLEDLEVSTVVNDTEQRTNTVGHMRYSPAFLVSFHSAVMPLYPGDIISTGTPGAIQIRTGDVAECRIPGVGVLTNPVAHTSRTRAG